MKKPDLWRVLDRSADRLICLCLLIVILTASYAAYDAGWLLDHAKDPTLRDHRPGDPRELVSEKSISEDQVAWLVIDDTSIDYPVMQADNNMEYLNKDPYGEFSLSGSIFLDYRNSPQFSDEYSILYGHHMENGILFGALDNFRDTDYTQSHREGSIITKEGSFRFTVFCVTEADARESGLFAPTGREQALERLKEQPLFYEEPQEGSLVALSTCIGAANTRRLMVVGTIKKDEE